MKPTGLFGQGGGFVPIQRYGGTWAKDGSWQPGPRKPLKLCYDGATHYDLLM